MVNAGTPVMQHWPNHSQEAIISYISAIKAGMVTYTYPSFMTGTFSRNRMVTTYEVLSRAEVNLYDGLAMLQSVDMFERQGKLDRAWAMLLESYKAGKAVLGGPPAVCELMDRFDRAWGEYYQRLAPLMRRSTGSKESIVHRSLSG